MKTLKLCLLLFVCSRHLIFAQTNISLPNIIPPSPNAASLGKYAEWPISYYNGTTNISIPIWNIETKKFKFPISLSYHASGIKVEENASWVGLGWALNSTGIITRTVKGKPDELYYMNSSISDQIPDPITTLISGNYWFRLIGASSSTLLDGEPDEFFFNINGRSGKFILDQNGIPHINPTQDLKIIPNWTNYSWTIINEDGIRYIFGTAPNSVESQSFTSFENSIAVSSFTFNSSWYLTRVEDQTGKELISFNYKAETYQYKSAARERKQVEVKGVGERIYSGNSTTMMQGCLPTEINWSNGKIIFESEARDDLEPYSTNPPPQKLRKIKIYNTSDLLKPVKIYDFDIGCFNQGVSSTLKYKFKRLKLNKLYELDCNAVQVKPPYEFVYDGETPDKESAAQDHWGYFNSVGNTSLRSSFSGMVNAKDEMLGFSFNFYTPVYVVGKFFTVPGADRSPRFPDMRLGTLLSIKYPTGGSSAFEYEQHDCGAVNNDVLTKIVESGNQAYVAGDSQTSVNQATFTLTSTTSASFAFEFSVSCWDKSTKQPCDCSDTNAQVNYDLYHENSAGLYGSTGNEIIAAKWITGDGGFWIYRYGSTIDNSIGMLNPDGSNFITRTISITLDPGTYTLKAVKDTNCQTDIFGWAYYNREVPIDPTSDKVFLGGLRIKKITSTDNLGKSLISDFDYKNVDRDNTQVLALSSGVLFGKPQYHSANFDFIYVHDGNANSEYLINDEYLEIGSGTINCLGSSQGSHIGYGCVKETQKDVKGKTNGYKIFRYQPYNILGSADTKTYGYYIGNESTGKSEISEVNEDHFPFPPSPSSDLNLGVQSSLTEYNINNTILKDETYYNAVINKDTINGLIAINIPIANKEFAGVHLIYFGSYKIYTGWNRMDKVSTTIYDVNGNNPNTSNSYFEYNGTSHIQVTRKKIEKSDGDLITEDIVYPKDKTSNDETTSGTITDLVTRNINTPLKSESHLNSGKIIQGSIVNYTKTSDGYLLPINVKKLKTDGTYEVEMNFTKYNSLGNLTEFADQSGISYCYIWGYHQTYPVAKIVGASYDDVKGLVDSTVLNNPQNVDALRNELNKLRTSDSLKGALITTYTYSLVGMTSQTDENGVVTKYEYDTLGRLQYIKNDDDKILKTIDYHYSGQTK